MVNKKTKDRKSSKVNADQQGISKRSVRYSYLKIGCLGSLWGRKFMR
jgi:hypothetical protein